MPFKERAREARRKLPSRSIDLGFVSPSRRTDAILQQMKPTTTLHRAGQSLWLDNTLGAKLQADGAKSFTDSWNELLTRIDGRER